MMTDLPPCPAELRALGLANWLYADATLQPHVLLEEGTPALFWTDKQASALEVLTKTADGAIVVWNPTITPLATDGQGGGNLLSIVIPVLIAVDAKREDAFAHMMRMTSLVLSRINAEARSEPYLGKEPAIQSISNPSLRELGEKFSRTIATAINVQYQIRN